MMFLLATFTAIKQLLDSGTSAAFFTFLSRRQRSLRFVIWVLIWLSIQFLIPIACIGLLFPDEWLALIWKSDNRELVLLAFAASFIQSTLWTAVVQMGESQRLTHLVQGTSVVAVILHLSLVSLFFWRDNISVPAILTFMVIEWVLAIIFVSMYLRFPKAKTSEDNLKSTLREFYDYCLPLVPYTWLGFLYQFLDRWLLQNFGGSVEQAYYAIGYQWGAISLLATQSILNIFWKEIAQAHQEGNHELLEILYKRVSRAMFFAATTVGFFLVPWAKDLLFLILGADYIGGYLALVIMLIYPMYQALGQIVGTMMYATGRVKAQVIIGSVFMVTSIVVSYFVLASDTGSLPGFDLGSVGLAGKMVVMTFLSVNGAAYYLSRNMGMRFDWKYQPATIATCAGASWAAYLITNWLVSETLNIWICIVLSGCVYLVFIISACAFIPSLIGSNRLELKNFRRRLKI